MHRGNGRAGVYQTIGMWLPNSLITIVTVLTKSNKCNYSVKVFKLYLNTMESICICKVFAIAFVFIVFVFVFNTVQCNWTQVGIT